MQETREQVGKTTLVMTGVIILSKLVGFIREKIIAFYFGAGMESDVYTLAFSVLSVMVLLFSACVTSTFIPIYSKTLTKDGQKAADDYANNILHLFTILAVVVAFLGVVFAPNIIKIVMADTSDSYKFALTVKSLQIMFPSLVFSLISSVYASVLNARYKFIAPQLIGFAISVCTVISVVLFADKIGIYALAYGTFFSMLMQILILVPFLKREYHYYPKLDMRDEKLKRTFRLAVPILIGTTVNELNFMIGRYLASGLVEGSVSALRYAYNLITLVMGVFIIPTTTIQFTRLSSFAVNEKIENMKNSIKQSIELIALMILPIISVSVIMGEDIIHFVYGGGKFESVAVDLTKPVFLFYIVGLLGFGFREFLNRSFYAIQDTKTPMVVSGFAIAVNIALSLILVEFMGAGGIALAASISAVLGSLIMLFLLRKKIGKMGMKGTVIQLTLIALSAVICAFICLTVKSYLSETHHFLRLIIAAAAGLGVYAIALIVFKVKEMKNLISALTKRIKKQRV